MIVQGRHTYKADDFRLATPNFKYPLVLYGLGEGEAVSYR